MLKISATFVCSAFIAYCAAPALAQSLTGDMATTQYLVGTWDCSVTEMQMTGGTRQENATLTFAIVPGNALSQMINSPTFSSVGFIGFNTQTSQFFSNTVNSMGGISTQTATRPGSPVRIVFTGTATQGGQSAPTRDTNDKISDTRIHGITEINVGGRWTKVADASCTKH